MTATEVGGKEVITAEAVPSNLWTKERPIYWSSVVKLLLSDDTTIYGCSTLGCDYVSEKSGQVRTHVTREHRKKLTGWDAAREKVAEREAETQAAEADDDNEDDILAALEAAINGNGKVGELEKEVAKLQKQIGALTKQRDYWRSEAGTANARLGKLRTALRGAIGTAK